MRTNLLALAFLVLMASPAAAQLVGTDTAPGDSCAGKPAGATRMTADADQDGKEVVLICDGSIWRAASEPAADPDRGIQFNSGGDLTADANLTYTEDDSGNPLQTRLTIRKDVTAFLVKDHRLTPVASLGGM